MHRCCKCYAARHHNHCRIVQERRVEGCEYVVVECCVTTEMRFDHCGVLGNCRRQVGNRHASVGGHAGQLRRIDTIDKHQPGAGFFKIKVLDVGSLQTRDTTHRLERQLGEPKNVGKAPRLVALGGHRQYADALHRLRAQRGKEELDPLEFDDFVREKMKLLEMSPDFLERSVNEGFSGGEKKRNEILQMALLAPRLAILDETDSGLDIDALRIVSQGVNQLASKDNAIVLVTHYQRLLNYIVPDFVHVMDAGRIIKTGGKELALELESRGYDWVGAEHKATATAGATA